MPEIADVVAATEIDVDWGNPIRSRTLQRYDDIATRTSENGTPEVGDLAFLEDTGEVSVYFSGAWRNLVPTGSVMPFAGSSTPPGWLTANGQTISRTTYAALFAAIGTSFGSGDGSTTFEVPDLRQKFPLGVASSGTGSTRGDTGGVIDHTHSGPSHTHTTPNHNHTMPSHSHTGPSHTHSSPNHTHSMPTHTHSFSDTSGGPSSATSTLAFGGSGQSAGTNSHTHFVSGTTGAKDPGDTNGSGTGVTGSGGTGSTSSDDPGDTWSSAPTTNASGTAATGTANPPFIALNFIIKH